MQRRRGKKAVSQETRLVRHLLLSINYPPRTGGSGRWFAEIYPRALDNNFVVATAPVNELAKGAQPDPPNVVRFPMEFGNWGLCQPRAALGYLKAWLATRRLLWRHHFQAVHAGRALPEGWLAWMLYQTGRTPYLVYCHGEDISIFKLSREHTFLARRVLRSARLLVANSHNTARILQEEWPESSGKVHVLHPGVDTRRFSPALRSATERARWNWHDKTVLLTVGRLQKRKGHDMLLQALPIVQRHHPTVLYAIVGDGEERKPLEQLTQQMGLQQSVQFWGEVPDEQLVELYQQADLFVLPNRTIGRDFEGFGMVLLEAQACGLPVIAGRSGGTAETMLDGQTGLLVDCSRPEPLGEAIVGLLGAPSKRDQMGKKARQWVVEQFDWEVLKKKAREVFGLLEEN